MKAVAGRTIEGITRVEAVVLKVDRKSARVRILGEDRQVTFRSGDVSFGHLPRPRPLLSMPHGSGNRTYDYVHLIDFDIRAGCSYPRSKLRTGTDADGGAGASDPASTP